MYENFSLLELLDQSTRTLRPLAHKLKMTTSMYLIYFSENFEMCDTK